MISSKLICASCVGYVERAYYGFDVTSPRMLVGNNLSNSVSVKICGCGYVCDMIFYWSVWIPCSRINTPRENIETPSTFQTSFLEAMLGELGRLSCLELATEPSPQVDPPRRIYRLANYPQRDFGRPRWMDL